MDNIRNLVNHPNFGRAIATNKSFRSVFGEVAAEESISNILSRFEMTGEGSLRDRFGTVFQRSEGESFTDYLHRSAFQLKTGFSQVREYDPSRLSSAVAEGNRSTYFSGGQTNFPLIEAAKKKGYTARVASFKPRGNEAEYIAQFLGVDKDGIPLGLVVPDQEQVNILQMFEQSGKPVNLNEIFETLGVSPKAHPSVFKRLKIFTSDREISRVADPGERIKTLLFDPEEIFKSNPILQRAAKEAERTGDVGTLTEAYTKMSDGLSIITESGLRRTVGYMDRQADQMMAELENDVASGAITEHGHVYQENIKAVEAMREETKRLRRGITDGKLPGGFNARVFGAVEYGNEGRVIDFTKGDAVYFSHESVVRFLKNTGKYSEDILEDMAEQLDFITSRPDVKDEIEAIANPFMTLFHQPAVRGMNAYSNSLTMATMGDLIDPMMASGDRYLLHSLKAEIDDGLDAIRRGEMTPGLMKVIEDFENEAIPVDISPNEKIALAQGKLYAKRLRNFVKGGGDLKSNPFMAQQAIDVIRKHHFRKVTDKNGIPKKVMFGGVEQEQLMLRAPMRMASRTHMANAEMMGIRELPAGMASYDERSGRYLYSGASILSARTAQGGSDLDDAVYMSLKYDTKTRRLFYHSLRDPNAMGEFMFYDVNLLTDPHIDSRIKQFAGERQKLITSLLYSKNVAGTEDDMAKLNEINNILHTYFSGGDVTILGETFSQKDIATIDLAKQYAKDTHRTVFAPKGFTVTEESAARYAAPSPLKGFVTTEMAGGRDAFFNTLLENFKAQNADSGVLDPFSLFDFVGKSHSDAMKMGLFQTDDAIEAALANVEKIDPKAAPVLTGAYMFQRMADEAKGRGLLGQFVNQFSLIERFHQDYLNIDNLDPNVDQEAAKRFQQKVLRLIQDAGLTTMEREAVIDVIVKTGDAKVLERIPEIMEANASKFGKLIKDVQTVAAEEKLNIGVGVDPYLYTSRGMGMGDLMMQGYEGVHEEGAKAVTMDRLLLSENDPMAYLSSVFKSFSHLEKELATTKSDEVLRQTAHAMIQEFSDFTPTPLEATRAQEFLNQYGEHMSVLKANLADKDEMLKKLTEGLTADNIDDVLAPYTEDAVKAKSLMQLNNWGLEKDIEGMDRQLIAIAQLAANQMIDTGKPMRGALDAISRDVSSEELPSINKMFMGARFRHLGLEEDILDQIGDIDTLDYENFESIYKDFVKYQDGRNVLVGKSVMDHVNQKKVVSALIHSATDMRRNIDYDIKERQAVGDENVDFLETKWKRVNRLVDDLYMHHHFSDLRGRAEPVRINDAGMGRYLARELSDKTADEVTSGKVMSDTFNAMKRLDRKAVADLMEIPAFRKGAIGAGIFAGIGLLYGATKDRSYGDMQGPALLPGGSAYEDYNDVPPDMSSIYSTVRSSSFGPGVLYKINMNGSFDSNEMRDRIQGITGSPVDTRINRSRQTMSGPQSAQQLMNNLIG